jgi:putative oxidoreductase
MCKHILNFLAQSSPWSTELGLFILRVSIGIIMMCHGFPKIAGGFSIWHNVGMAMANLGIHFLPTVWGLIAAITESCGSLAFTLGFGTRIASVFLSFMMFVALLFHLNNGDSYTIYSHALTLLVLFISFIIMGGGRWSLDHWYCSRD